ncbi:hypothetical protein [Butyrivibrio sp. MC2013]|uniref:hypothetical protein n=1 Tax=Butyrivibrio sp. MC2013 TaxID=1280686 RepID=UPI00047B0DEE|nr:hypothetical protein [Butyrivibrio sp. MC2013]
MKPERISEYMKKEKEYQAMLDEELREYLKVTKMTAKERKALREWVATGHSVHENNAMAVYEGGCPIDFLDIYREEEEIRQATKEMSPEDARKYAMEYYGWSDEPNDHEPEPLDDIDFSKIEGKILDFILGD